MKLLKLLNVTAIHLPCFTAVQQGGQHKSSVGFDFGAEPDAFVVPQPVVESAKGGAGLGDAQRHFCIKGSVAAEGAVQVAKLVD